MRILVTGGSGLVGTGIKRICDVFKSYDITLLSSKDCNLLDINKTRECLSQHNPEVVIHLAANVGGLFKNMNQKVQMFEDNIMMNMNILKACHESKVSKFFGMLSTCIFPDESTYPIDESMLQQGPPHTSNDAYAYAKRMLKVHCDAYNEQYDTNYSCIIPTNIYGENDNYNLEDAHVIPALIHKCYLAKQNNRPFVVSGTGKPLRQFIHADDLATIILSLIDQLNRECIIVTPSEEISIKDVAVCIAQAFEYDHMIRFDASKSDGQYKKTASNQKLKTMLPDFRFKDFTASINNVVKYFNDNFETIRK